MSEFDQYKFEKLITEVEKIISNQEKEFEDTGCKFDIFKILKLSNDELVHSAFIAELLNPHGSHYQKSSFLDFFINDIVSPLCNDSKFDKNSAKVVCEKYISEISGNEGGRIDIYLEDDTRPKNKIIIENKIYAQDQEMQLVRYHNYAPNAIILYLTLDGHKPSDDSITDKNTNKKLIDGEDFFCISYAEHILPWLEKCYQNVEDKRMLAEGINHYIKTIETLTGKNMTLNKQISQYLIEKTERIETALDIEAACTSLKQNIQMDFWCKLYDSLNDSLIYYQNVVPSEKEASFNCAPQKITNKKELQTRFMESIGKYHKSSNCRYGLTIPIGKLGKYEIKWCVLILHSVYYGFVLFNEDKLVDLYKIPNDYKQGLREFSRLFKEKAALDAGFPYTEWIEWRENSIFFILKEEPEISFKNNSKVKEYINKQREAINNDIDDISQKTKLSIKYGKETFAKVFTDFKEV